MSLLILCVVAIFIALAALPRTFLPHLRFVAALPGFGLFFVGLAIASIATDGRDGTATLCREVKNLFAELRS